jgi:hypothetical protein
MEALCFIHIFGKPKQQQKGSLFFIKEGAKLLGIKRFVGIFVITHDDKGQRWFLAIIYNRWLCERRHDMENMLHKHPDENVRKALIGLVDALCSWERSTGNEHLIIVKDTARAGYEYRVLASSPVPEHMGDHSLIEAFDGVLKRFQSKLA